MPTDAAVVQLRKADLDWARDLLKGFINVASSDAERSLAMECAVARWLRHQGFPGVTHVSGAITGTRAGSADIYLEAPFPSMDFQVFGQTLTVQIKTFARGYFDKIDHSKWDEYDLYIYVEKDGDTGLIHGFKFCNLEAMPLLIIPDIDDYDIWSGPTIRWWEWSPLLVDYWGADGNDAGPEPPKTIEDLVRPHMFRVWANVAADVRAFLEADELFGGSKLKDYLTAWHGHSIPMRFDDISNLIADEREWHWVCQPSGHDGWANGSATIPTKDFYELLRNGDINPQ